MGNYNRLLSGEFPPEPARNEHEELTQRLDKEMEEYLQETAEWIEQVKVKPEELKEK